VRFGVGHRVKVVSELGREIRSDSGVVGFADQPSDPARQPHQHGCCRLDVARCAANLFALPIVLRTVGQACNTTPAPGRTTPDFW
jgi:hypothetical protein